MSSTHLALYRIAASTRPDASIVGGKAIRLWTLRQRGVLVPDGVIVPVPALRILTGDDGSQVFGSAEDALTALRAKSEPPVEFATLVTAVRSIEGFDEADPVAVRSAALGEDGSETSFAGQYTTVLGVTLDGLWDALVQCYAAWWSAEAIAYRTRAGAEEASALSNVSVVVQRQLHPTAAGVAFSRDPMSGGETFVIEAVEGLGDRLVSGLATPARWHVDRHSRAVVRFDAGATAIGRDAPFIAELVGRVLEAEAEFRTPQDVEWAFENGHVYLLQSRDITTLKAAGAQMLEHTVRHVYARAILEDLWSDHMSPMTSSVMFDEFSEIYTFKKPMRRLGLSDLAAKKSMEVIDGYAYVSADVALGFVRICPPFLRFREIGQIFPVGLREAAMAVPLDVRRCLAALVRVPLALDDLAVLPFLTVPLLRRHVARVTRAFERTPLDRYTQQPLTFYAEELERLLAGLGCLLVRNQWGYGKATAYTWLLFHVARRGAGRDDAWVLDHVRHLPDNIAARTHRSLAMIADACDAEVRACLDSALTDAEAWRTLTTAHHDHPAVRMMREFVVTHRFRSGNRDFIHPRWDEEPECVVGFVRAKLGEPEGHHASAGTNASNHGIVDWAIDIALARPARRFLALREDLRFGLDKAFYRIRRLLIALSRVEPFAQLARVSPDAIFFLELNEVRALLRGATHLPAVLPLVADRRASFERSRHVSPPLHVRVENGCVLAIGGPASDSPAEAATGVAASPGIGVGPAVVIYGPEDFHRVRKGDILIAYNTDPGWTPLFSLAAGVAVEMGGILNHCAIVAREFRIPAVVGVPGITGRVRNGDIVTVDGYRGVVDVATPGEH